MALRESKTPSLRAGTQHSFARDVNERIEQVHSRLGRDGSEQFVCECVDPACRKHIIMTSSEYENVRGDATHFAVMKGHVREEFHHVVRLCDGFVVVETTGRVAEVARRLDPRAHATR